MPVLHLLWLLAALWGETAGTTSEVPRAAVLPEVATVRLLAVGDVNLGRHVGRVMLAGDSLFPFVAARDTFAAYDLVFANLESCLSEQGGETEHPRNNLIFTGPPIGARMLRLAGITMVATANNHALDYGPRGLSETMTNLEAAGITFSGSARRAGDLYEPAVFERNGIRIAFFACTAIMNMRPVGWDTLVAWADTARLFPRMRVWRDSVDFLILSYHGGEEYRDRAGPEVQSFGRAAVEAGADLVLGHHPHVPYGLERRGGKVIVHSLGNFVFRQPGRFWTEHSYGVAVVLEKGSDFTRIGSVRCLPVKCGFQPAFLPPGPDADRVLDRVRMLSIGVTKE
jgi:poly-gamma-glutamate capsule biosynthesis protein CapA/YwtB (metallophosphatase superfamily)